MNKMKPTMWGIIVFAVFAVWMIAGIGPYALTTILPRLGWNWLPSPEPSSGIIGDMFGMANALFSALAILGVIATLHLQIVELRENRAEYKAMVAAQQDSVSTAWKAARLTSEQFLAESFSSLILKDLRINEFVNARNGLRLSILTIEHLRDSSPDAPTILELFPGGDCEFEDDRIARIIDDTRDLLKELQLTRANNITRIRDILNKAVNNLKRIDESLSKTNEIEYLYLFSDYHSDQLQFPLQRIRYAISHFSSIIDDINNEPHVDGYGILISQDNYLKEMLDQMDSLLETYKEKSRVWALKGRWWL